MGHSDPTLQQALLYLQAAGYDVSRSTCERLEALIRTQPALSTDCLLETMPFWFDLDRPAASPAPPIVRASIGYERD